MKHRVDAIVKCPYYKFEDRQVIYCEGPQDGTATHLAFSTAPKLREYKGQYCKGCWKKCPLAEMLNRKWDYNG